MNAVIEVADAQVVYGGVPAVDGFSMRIEAGERIALLGRTGAGKSTILSLLVGSQKPDGGTVRVLGLDPFEQHRELQGRVSMAFQAPHLLPWRHALANARVGLEILGRPREEADATATAWLERVHLGDSTHKYPSQLSGGMRQRVSLARAFAIDPEIVFLDESFSALDEVTARQLRDDFTGLCDRSGVSSVIVTHSIEEAFQVAHRVIVLAQPAVVIAEYDSQATLEERDFAEVREEIRAQLDSGVMAR